MRLRVRVLGIPVPVYDSEWRQARRERKEDRERRARGEHIPTLEESFPRMMVIANPELRAQIIEAYPHLYAKWLAEQGQL